MKAASSARRGGPPREVADKCGPGGERRARWDGLRALWKISTNQRQRLCRHAPTGDVVSIEKRAGVANYSGLQTCASPWTCPCCGPKIAVERAADIALALTAHHADGGRIAMVTLTLRHSRAERLSALLDGLTGAWTSIRQNKSPRRLLSAHSVGFVKRLEVTVGPNGWHPHLHVLLFLTPTTTAEDVEAIATAMYTAWSRRLVRQGLGRPTEKRGVDARLLDLSAAHEKVAEYVAKAAAMELASAGTKRGRRGGNRTPMQLLGDLARHARAEDLAAWREYEQATRGRRSIQWSLGLRGRYLADVPELTDDEAAERNDGAARLLGCLDADTWRRVCRWPAGPAGLLAWAELYDDDDEARDAVARCLDRHNLGQLLAGPGP